MKKYLVVIEKTNTGFSSYVPDLPGCIATGKTKDEVEKNIIRGALHQTDGIIIKAADKLNLSFRSMRYRIQKHKLKGKSDPEK